MPERVQTVMNSRRRFYLRLARRAIEQLLKK
jgi:hypothetical protein